MAINTGKYNPNIDYAAEIAKAISPEQARVLEEQRNLKIADMNEMGTNKGYTETYAYNKPALSKPVVGVPDYYSRQQDLISNQHALQEKSRIDALKVARANVLSALSREETAINPAYRRGMSNIGSTASLQARNLAEYLAQRGQTSSGIAAQSRMNILGDALSRQSALEQQRASAVADIEQRRSATQSAYDAGEVQAATERAISETQELIDLANQERKAGIATIGQYSDDYASQINAIKALEARGDYSQSHLLPYLTIARNEKLAILADRADARNEKLATLAAKERRAKDAGPAVIPKPALTAAQAKNAYNEGVKTQQVVDAYNYYYGAGATTVYQDADELLSQRRTPSSQLALIESYYNQGKLTEAEAQALLDRYGLR